MEGWGKPAPLPSLQGGDMAETKLPAKQQDDEPPTPPNKSETDGASPAPAREPEVPPVKGAYSGKGD